MKRLGIAAIVVAALVFGLEGILALLRQRNIDVTIQIESALLLATPEATQQPGSVATPAAQAASSALIVDPNGRVLVALRWDYEIGPTFPRTVIHAQALDQAGKVVSSDQYTIDCGAASLNCAGAVSMSLDYGVQDKAGERAAWPAGDYTVQVTRAFTELNTTVIVRRALKVVAQ